MHLEGHGTLFSGIEKLVAGLYMTLLPKPHTLRFEKTYPDF